MELEFCADPVRIKVWKIELSLVSNFFLFVLDDDDWFMIPFWAICWRDELMLENVAVLEGVFDV